MKTRKKKTRTLAKTFMGKPALYLALPGQHDVEGPWCVKFDTEWGLMLERKHIGPGPFEGEPELRIIRNYQRSRVLDPAAAQALIDRAAADPRPQPGDYVAIVWDHTRVKNGFVVSTTPAFAEVLMEDGTTSRYEEWYGDEHWQDGRKKKVTRKCKIENMVVLARAEERAA